MSKRWEISTQFPPQKHRKSNQDRISQLPDEILVEILSRLKLREAVQTSIISHRWKNLWMFTTGNLEFEAPHVLNKIHDDFKTWVSNLEKERNKFSNWVTQVLKSHKGGLIAGLKVSFDLGITRKSTVDSWIDLAIQKKVVCLDFRLMPLYNHLKEDLYTFPKEVLSSSNIKFLKALFLSYIHVSGPLLEEIISKCTSLEHLSVTMSPTLVHAKIYGPSSLKLKFFEIRSCRSLEHLEVSAPNLLALSYFNIGVNTKFQIHNAPKLKALRIGGFYCFEKIPLSYCSQLDTLELDCSAYMISRIPPVLPKFKILKHLELKVRTNDENSLISWISLLKACPMLRTLGVLFVWNSSKLIARKMVKIEREELKCLKVVEFSSFAGRTSDVELAMCILENAPYLEKVIFEPLRPYTSPQWIWDRSKERSILPSWDMDDDRMAARECARQLAKDHSPTAKLIVL